MGENRLSKVLAAAGVASRRAAERLIFNGKVKVNGEVALLPQTLVDCKKDQIEVEGMCLQKEQPKAYFLLHKPFGYICSNKALDRKKLVVDLFEETGLRLFTVGRLDRDTTGLLIVTNDGHFANKVIHPSSNIAKEYLVKTDQEISHDHLVKISKGGMIEETFIKPLKVQKVRRNTAKIAVKEGKKREVRRFFEKAGLKVIELKRIRIGGLMLGQIPEGSYRELTDIEKKTNFRVTIFKKS